MYTSFNLNYIHLKSSKKVSFKKQPVSTFVHVFEKIVDRLIRGFLVSLFDRIEAPVARKQLEQFFRRYLL